MEKIAVRILSPKGSGKRVARLDNIKTLRFSWAEFESLITAEAISGRQLYEGEGSRPNYITWTLTLNGGSLSKDIAERVIIIKLATPEYDEKWLERVDEFIEKHRLEIWADCRDLLLAARPEGFRAQSRWPEWQAQVLSKVGLAAECQEIIAQRQAAIDSDTDEVEEVRAYFARQVAAYSGRDADTAHAWFLSQTATEWLKAALKRDFSVSSATTYLRGSGLVAAEEEELSATKPLMKHDMTKGRGWTWKGHLATGPEIPIAEGPSVASTVLHARSDFNPYA
jgi:hypothetical protein